MPLSSNDRESELSYAYLHAVASKAGLNCEVANRHADNYGIDARVTYFDKIPGTYITDVSLGVQLKATIKKGTETDTHIAYAFKGVDQYNRLRIYRGGEYRILVVLFLPERQDEWLTCSSEELIIRHSAYWVCLYGAEETGNSGGKTIYLPKVNLLTPESLMTLCQNIGKGNIYQY